MNKTTKLTIAVFCCAAAITVGAWGLTSDALALDGVNITLTEDMTITDENVANSVIDVGGHELNLVNSAVTSTPSIISNSTIKGSGTINVFGQASDFNDLYDMFMAEGGAGWTLTSVDLSEFTGTINANAPFVFFDYLGYSDEIGINPAATINVNVGGMLAISIDFAITASNGVFSAEPTININRPGISFVAACEDQCKVFFPKIVLNSDSIFGGLVTQSTGTFDITGIQPNCHSLKYETVALGASEASDGSAIFDGKPDDSPDPSTCAETPTDPTPNPTPAPDPSTPSANEDDLSPSAPSTGTASNSKSVSLSVVAGAISGSIIALVWYRRRKTAIKSC
jgi:hypothetical protein